MAVAALPPFVSALPEVIVLAMICVIMLTDVILVSINRQVVYTLSQLTLIVAAAFTWHNFNISAVLFHQQFVLSPLAVILKLFMYLMCFGVFLYGRRYNTEKALAFGEFHVLALISLLGGMVLVSANSLLVLYIGLELLSLPLYAMVALNRSSVSSTEAAMKYFIMGAVASGLLLYGISLVYGATGSLVLPTIASTIMQHQLAASPILVFATLFIVAGIGFKFGLVPFHMWVPDVYQGAPTSVTTLVATVAKLAGFGMLIRLLQEMLPAEQLHWGPVLMALAVLSLIVGNIAAIAQKNIKRMFAYSTIGHVGFIFLAVALGTASGYSDALFYAIVYAITSLGGFGMLVLLSQQGQEFEYLEDFAGLNSRHPWLAFMMMLLLLSMAGIPPLVGFDAKLMVLLDLVRQGHLVIAAIALITSVIGAYYYLRVIKVMYFDAPIRSDKLVLSGDAQSAITINGLAVLLLGCLPGALMLVCQNVF